MDELENYIAPILDNNLVGEDYREILETQKDEWQMYVDMVSGRLESGKMTLEKYLEIVVTGQKEQTEALKRAKAKKASITTIQRIEKRLGLIKGEISDLRDQMGDTGGQQVDEEEIPAKEEQTAPAPKKVEPEQPKKPKFKVPEDKLEQLSKRLNQYKYFLIYCHENGIDGNNHLLATVKDVKDLFKTPYAITPEQYEKAVESLPSITIEMILGMTPAERDAKIEQALKDTNEAFEIMKELSCTKDEALGTVETLKYLKKLNEIPTARFPKLRTDDLQKVAANKTNQNIPEDCVRLTIVKLSGGAGHRSIFIKYCFDYGGGNTTGDTEYVGIFDAARRQQNVQPQS
jgi:uncharacterized protein YlbG (UPF0298 family)